MGHAGTEESEGEASDGAVRVGRCSGDFGGGGCSVDADDDKVERDADCDDHLFTQRERYNS